MLAPGAHKSTGIYPTTSATQQRWGSISNLMICRGMAPLFRFYAQTADNMTTHRKSHGYTQITKPKFKHGKWECVKTKQACLRSQTRTPPQVFSWKSTLAPLNPAGSGPSVCGLSVINLFLTEARLYVRDFFFFSAGRMFFVLTTLAERSSLFA